MYQNVLTFRHFPGFTVAATIASVALIVPHAVAGPGLALVIGNGDYKPVATLANPGNDARLLAGTLRGNCKARWINSRMLEQAHDLLAPVYGRFTVGFDARDLRNAKALLNTLAS